jgi:hypothetical protein
MIEKKLELALERWRVLAAACKILDQIRSTYESQRQPETLQEASAYLERLTQGRYQRVWTPLGEHTLRVDDAEGRSLPVEILSRGTREQLFLSLRMALAAGYARRGAALPLVLDDVLVNFDADRASAAAAVLRDFAAAGHQLLVFTCHQHISNIFASLGVPVGRLPDASNTGRTSISFEIAGDKGEKVDTEAKRPRNRSSNRRKTDRKVTLAEKTELPREPAEQNPPLVKTATKHKPSQIVKPKDKTHGVFDADFFDSSQNSENESLDLDRDQSPRADITDECDDYYQFNGDSSAEAA